MNGFLSLLLILSITLNVGFLTGCATIHDTFYGNSCNLKMVEFERIKKDLVQAKVEFERTKKDLDQAKRELSESRSRQGGYGKAELTRIAQLLDIPTNGKSASDLVSDICYKLDRSTDVPDALDAAAFDKLFVRLLSGEKPALEKYQRFISGLQGKRIIVIEPEN